MLWSMLQRGSLFRRSLPLLAAGTGVSTFAAAGYYYEHHPHGFASASFGQSNNAEMFKPLAPPQAIAYRGGLRSAVHCVHLALVFAPLVAGYLLHILHLLSVQSLDRLLCWSLEQAGPTFIKLGQWVSTRPDLFGPELCRTLGGLRADAPLHSFAHTERTLLEELKVASISEVFDWIERDPVHSGCVAQIHRATLRPDRLPEPEPEPYVPLWRQYWRAMRDVLVQPVERVLHDPRDVAVKVLHPGMQRQVLLDLSLMHWVAVLLTRCIPHSEWLGFREAVDQFGHFMLEQLDLRIEAEHLLQFCRLFRNDPEVVFPRPYAGLVTRSVLVEEFVAGPHVNEWMRVRGTTADEKRIMADVGLRAFLSMLFRFNYIHSDLHPGNMIVLEAGNHPRLALLDAGLVTRLTERDWVNFVELFSAVAIGDGDLAADLMWQRAPRHECVDVTGFRKSMGKIVNDFNWKDFAHLNVGATLAEILDTSRRYRVMLDSNFTSLVTAIIVLEGLGTQLKPDLNLVKEASPYLLQWLIAHATTLKCLIPMFQQRVIRPMYVDIDGL
eukprot:TRINITY_DN80799_c0_g1_i1.p1 TRINITY_DN80799_c0_g1~~TRINITY_DN80799_c0_g1_i1.p1  ORF type:complete len:553 (+),score=105.34 TRINITY_DN80799_c0_g1_i1:1708-3366(+)